MTIIYICENNCECLAVTVKNNELIRVQKLKDVSDDKNIIYEVNPIETFIGKDLTEDKKDYDGNTILIKLFEENNKHRFVYIGGDKVCSFTTDDKIYKYISNMGNNLTPYSIAIGWENIYFLTPYFRVIKKENIDVDNIDKVFDIDYDDIMSRGKTEINKIHSNYD